MSRAQGVSRADITAFVAMIVGVLLVAATVAAMTLRTSRVHCDATVNPSTSAPVSAACPLARGVSN